MRRAIFCFTGVILWKHLVVILSYYSEWLLIGYYVILNSFNFVLYLQYTAPRDLDTSIDQLVDMSTVDLGNPETT